MRAFNPETLARLQDRATRLCRQIAAAHGLTADVAFTGEYPVTVNDPDARRVRAGRSRPICSGRNGRSGCPIR